MDQLLTVTRWRRYGADRLFVTQETGAPLGSVDLQSGEVVVDEPGHEERLRLAAQEYLRSDVAELVLPVPRTGDELRPEEREALERWLGGGEVELDREGRGSPLRLRLERLQREGWQVLHDVPIGRQGSVIAHLLVGHGGVITVSERQHRGQHIVVSGRSMTVDGEPVHHLRDARLEAARVQTQLLTAGVAGVTVRAVLVMNGSVEVQGKPDDMTVVVPRQAVPAVFRTMPDRLEQSRIAPLVALARQRTTWTR